MSDPRQIPPGLPAIPYRAGNQVTIKQAMLDAISKRPALNQLTTREDDDPAIALMDSWAAALDVLTFYQERIANEGYLRTATERFSTLQLARSIGYELNPGVAASVVLGFTLDDAVGSPGNARIDTGAKAQSIPAQNQLPQTFETIEPLDARTSWNVLRARAGRPIQLQNSMTELYIAGVANGLVTGDSVLLVGDERVKNRYSPNWSLLRILNVTTDSALGRTLLRFDTPLAKGSYQVPQINPKLYAMRQRANLFGYNAPAFSTLPAAIAKSYPNDGFSWYGFNIDGVALLAPGSNSGAGFNAVYYSVFGKMDDGIERIDRTIDFNWDRFDPSNAPPYPNKGFVAGWRGKFEPGATGTFTFHVRATGGVTVYVNGVLVINNRNGIITDATGTVDLDQWFYPEIDVEYIDGNAPQYPYIHMTVTPPGGGGERSLNPFHVYPLDSTPVYLDQVYPKIQSGTWAVVSMPESQSLCPVVSASDDGRSGWTLNAKTTRLMLETSELAIYDLRRTTVFGQSELLEWADQPIPDNVYGSVIELASIVYGLEPGRLLLLSGTTITGIQTSEVAIIDSIENTVDSTILHLTVSPANTYVRSSVTINANAARATHGETRTEILGSGNASQPFQQFTLKQKPLTYTSAALATGGQSTLEVRADGLLWREVVSLFAQGPHDRVYATRLSEDGSVTIQFGDGIHGSRLPTGSANVTAKYRTGTGLAGMLAPNQLSLLMTRPLGVKSVTNPLATDGAADPEQGADARRNAPLTVLTLDRIVSVRDYEDFARGFAGISKAQATVLWEGEHTFIHLTIASVTGAPIDPTSALYQNLSAAIAQYSDPSAKVRIASYDPVTFGVSCGILADPAYQHQAVVDAARAALLNAFSFANHDLGQSVTTSHATSIVQQVPGVTATGVFLLLDGKYIPGNIPSLPARWTTSPSGIPVISPAQLLLIDPANLHIEAGDNK